VFYRVTRAAFIGGGRDCRVEGNLFVDCEPALHIDGRALGWASYHVGTTMKERLDAIPYEESPWADRYPELLTLWDDEPAAPKGNLVRGNVSQGGTWDDVFAEARPYVDLSANLVSDTVGFCEPPPRSFRLRDDSPAYATDFRPIPLEGIGVYEDEMRASWPVSRGGA